MKIDELSDVIEHYKKGGTFLMSSKHGDVEAYLNSKDIKEFDFANYNYSIYHEPTQKKTAVMEKWLCETAWGDYIAIEASVGHFKTTKYKQVRLLEAYEVVL